MKNKLRVLYIDFLMNCKVRVASTVRMRITHHVFCCTGAQLQLFGSSKNGFGFRQSDLDICMVLEGQGTIDVSPLLILQA